MVGDLASRPLKALEREPIRRSFKTQVAADQRDRVVDPKKGIGNLRGRFSKAPH